MSDDHDHESPIKTPKQLITIIVLSFAIPIALIVLLVSYVTGGKHGADAESPAMKSESVAERIRPLAAVNVKDPNAAKVFQTGEALYKQVCAACHDSGAAGAPKFGDKAAWAARIGQGLEGLFASVSKGKGAMPPRAGTLADDVSEYELQRAIVYMANAGGASLQEPAAPAAAAKPAAAAEAAPAAATAAAPAVVIPAAAPAAAPATAKADVGKALYDSNCQVCHAAGVAGAPKFGDKAAWAPRIAKGMPELYKSGINGKPPGMPPKGTAMAASDDDIKAAVDYMASAAK